MTKKTYKERRLYYYTCTKCGTRNRHSLKRRRAKHGLCRKCRGKQHESNKNQLSLFQQDPRYTIEMIAKKLDAPALNQKK